MRIKTPEAPGNTELAKHPMLWGYPLPAWTDNGLVYTGKHWTSPVYEDLIIWTGKCLDAIKKWIYGPGAHRKYLTQHKRISIACAQARAQGAEGNDFAKAVDAILPTITLTRDDQDKIEDQVEHADRARVHLWNIANQSSPKTRPNTMDELAQWVTKHRADLLLRLAQVELIPRPPAAIIPTSIPANTTKTPSRHAKLASKPTADPEMETIF